jgi:hypothetical protein
MKKMAPQAIDFKSISTDPAQICCSGTRMPALLRLKAYPPKFLRFILAGYQTPHLSASELIRRGVGDTAGKETNW